MLQRLFEMFLGLNILEILGIAFLVALTFVLFWRAKRYYDSQSVPEHNGIKVLNFMLTMAVLIAVVPILLSVVMVIGLYYALGALGVDGNTALTVSMGVGSGTLVGLAYGYYRFFQKR